VGAHAAVFEARTGAGDVAGIVGQRIGFCGIGPAHRPGDRGSRACEHPPKRGKKSPGITLTAADGATRRRHGWEDPRQLQESGHLPPGSVATTTVTDDTLPGGPRKVERRYWASSALANREEDYKLAWAHFERMRHKRKGV